MSDTEHSILKWDSSIHSEDDLDEGPALRSVSSINLIQQQQKQQQITGRNSIMSEDNSENYKPGHQKPPHPPPGYKNSAESSHHQSPQHGTSRWQLHARDSLSSIPYSPKKDTSSSSQTKEEIQVFSISPSSQLLYDGTHHNVAQRGHLHDLENPRKHGNRRKNKYNRSESTPLESMSSAIQGSGDAAKTSNQKQVLKKRTEDAGDTSNRDNYLHSNGVQNSQTQQNRVAKDRNQASDRVGDAKKIKSTSLQSVAPGTLLDKNVSEGGIDETDSGSKSGEWDTHTVKAVTTDPQAQTNINQTALALYITNNFQQRECKTYARDKKSESKNCQCGRSVQWHKEKDITVKDNTEHIPWDTEIHTTLCACDSFGEIMFQGFGSQSQNSPYLRLDNKSKLEKVWMLLTKYWGLPIPKLIISVTGGAKRFSMRPRLKSILKQGLVTAAVSTGAWITTGGTAAGVMEFVGEAVQDYIMSTSNPEQNQCVALGIVAWGAVANNKSLDGEGEKGLFPAKYSMEDIQACDKRGAALDHNHTHFLLVDDGTEGKYGGEIEFRSHLESYISNKVETGVAESQSINVPSVLIVVEGGVNTLKTVHESINQSTPVVIIDGSGRAADFIADAYRITKSKSDEDETVFPGNFEDEMVKKAKKLFEWKPADPNLEKNCSESIALLKGCLSKRKLLNVFKLDKADSEKDIDRAILYALLRANKSNANSQIALALAWNRCDIARQEIFSSSNREHWQNADLYGAMFTALVQNRADFVQLFIDHGVDLKRFLNISTLWNLYNTCITDITIPETQLLRYLITYWKQPWSAFLLCRGMPEWNDFPDLLQYIGKVTVHLLQDQNFNFYKEDAKYTVKGKPVLKWSNNLDTNSQSTSSAKKRHKDGDVCDFSSPERELLLWAVLFNRRQLVHLFWKQGRDHIGGALFASALLKALSQVADEEEEDDLSLDMKEHAILCEKWAVSVLSECYTRDKQLTHQLLVRELPHWGGTTLFKMAESYNMMDFTEHSACQTKLSIIWKGRMALYTSEMKISLCIVCPLLVPFIKFTVELNSKKGEDNRQPVGEKSANSENDTRSKSLSPQHQNRVTPNNLPDDDGDGVGFIRAKSRRKHHNLINKFNKVRLFDFRAENINIFYAVYYFYQAPVTKFLCNIIAYLIFMGIFSYFVLVKLTPSSPSEFEYITWAWLATMIIDEVRQVLMTDELSFKYKVKKWWDNVWNQFDLAMYLLFAVAIILRYQLDSSSFVWARIAYSVTLAMFFLRLLQYLYAEKNLGPKVIMIRKMLTDLMFFFLIFLVFMLSFGTAYHANMYPESPDTWEILVKVLYYPYFQMHGNLFLEEMEGQDVNGCTRNETLWMEDPSTRCPSKNAVVPTLLAVYMILTNILLVNLLIAMFSYTFQSVQENSLKLWRYYRLTLVYEYFDRPTLVPPIIIFNHIFRLVSWIIYRQRSLGHHHNDFKITFSEETQKQMMMFERSSMETFQSNSKQLLQLSLDSRVATTAERIEHVVEELEVIKERIQNQEKVRQHIGSLSFEERPVEADILERFQPETEQNRLASQQQEMERLRATVEQLAEQSSQSAKQLDQMTKLLEKVLAERPKSAKHLVHQSGMNVEDLEDSFGESKI